MSDQEYFKFRRIIPRWIISIAAFIAILYIFSKLIEQFHFGNLRALRLTLFLIPVAAAIYLYSFHRKEKALKTFAHIEALKHISTDVNKPKQIWKSSFIITAVLLIIFALMRPQGNPTEEKLHRRGRDVVFLLDVSKSMLAQDLKPNRLERAKMAIKDVLNIMEGDRVGLIIFAGNKALKCPLTLDYYFFKSILDKISPKDLSRGGTNIGDAIRMATEQVFEATEQPKRQATRRESYKDMILITDGEDLADSFPVEAAEFAAKSGIRIHTVGLGDPDGTRVPDINQQGQYLRYNGEVVRSQLDEKLLIKIAAAANGNYIPVRTGTFDLGELYEKAIAPAEKKEHQSRITRRYEEWFQVPLLIAIALITTEMFVSERQKSKNKSAK